MATKIDDLQPSKVREAFPAQAAAAAAAPAPAKKAAPTSPAAPAGPVAPEGAAPAQVLEVPGAPEVLEELGKRMEKAKKIAPTRPHPRAPDSPPGNLVSGTMAAVMDRGRDLVRGAADKMLRRRNQADA